MIDTGVFATKEEVEEVMGLANLPVIYPFRDSASPQERCHELALAHGLPEITGRYGMKKDGEFIKM